MAGRECPPRERNRIYGYRETRVGVLNGEEDGLEGKRGNMERDN